MYIEQAIMEHLLQQAGLTALVGNRIYYVNAEQSVKTPYIVFFKASSVREHSHDGPTGLARARFQFSIFADTYAEAKDVAKQIQTALQGKNEVIGGASGVRASILYDDETDLYEDNFYHIALDFIVMHPE